MSDWRCFPGTEELDRALAQHVAAQLAADILEHGQASLAVSGGGTPRKMFQQLSQCELVWSRVWISLVDERWVSVDSQDSNERLVRENLLQNRATAAHFVSLVSQHENANDGLTDVGKRMDEIPQPWSTVVLGMGGDGHTASWFPQATNLQELLNTTGTRQIDATQPVTAPHQRITLTLPAVLNSRQIIIHITGDEKKSVLENARQQHYPIAAILEQKTTPATIWWAP
jgi:6-phosphogluconolactonase